MTTQFSIWLRAILLATFTSLVVACGSDNTVTSNGDNPTGEVGNDGGDDGDPGVTPSPTVASLDLITSNTELRSDADTSAEGVSLTALAKDSSNNLISGTAVSFSSTSGAISVTQGTTDENGVATATLLTAGDPENRQISVSASSGGQSDTLAISVTGTTLDITGPTSIGTGDSNQFSITLLNAGSEGIANETVEIASENGYVSFAMSVSETNSQGLITFEGIGQPPPSTADGTDTITVTALGLTATQTITVSEFDLNIVKPDEPSNSEIALGDSQDFLVEVRRNGVLIDNSEPVAISVSTTRGSLNSTGGDTNNGTFSFTLSASPAEDDGKVSAGPVILTAAAANGASESLELEFVAENAASISVQARPSTIPINGTSEIRAVVRDTDGNLVKNKTVDFELFDLTNGSLSTGAVTTSSQGVATVTYTAGSVNSGNEEVEISASVRGTDVPAAITMLTVGGQALRISLGTGNELVVPSTTTYADPYVAIVTDPAGNPAPPDTVFRLSARSTAYRTGFHTLVDEDDDDAPDYWEQGGPAEQACASEDGDADGILDNGEDVNNSGSLEPFAVASVLSSPDLDENGQAFFEIPYPKNHCHWTRIMLTATATVSGTETTASTEFWLRCVAADFEDPDIAPPGAESPYNEFEFREIETCRPLQAD